MHVIISPCYYYYYYSRVLPAVLNNNSMTSYIILYTAVLSSPYRRYAPIKYTIQYCRYYAIIIIIITIFNTI